jgi:hypothetical protein
MRVGSMKYNLVIKSSFYEVTIQVFKFASATLILKYKPPPTQINFSLKPFLWYLCGCKGTIKVTLCTFKVSGQYHNPSTSTHAMKIGAMILLWISMLVMTMTTSFHFIICSPFIITFPHFQHFISSAVETSNHFRTNYHLFFSIQ